jgi:ABC-type Co2+ transport system permease subunit
MSVIPSEIRKDSVLYRIAYGKRKEEEQPQENINLCDTIALAAVMVVEYALKVVVVTVISVIVLYMAGLFFYVLVLGVLSAINSLTDPASWALHEKGGPTPLGTICLILAVVLVLFGLAALYARWKKSEARSLLLVYMWARKEQYCPVLKVV